MHPLSNDVETVDRRHGDDLETNMRNFDAHSEEAWRIFDEKYIKSQDLDEGIVCSGRKKIQAQALTKKEEEEKRTEVKRREAKKKRTTDANAAAGAAAWQRQRQQRRENI